MHLQTWQLHDAVFELARGLGLRSYRVECKAGPEGETIISLVLSPPVLRMPGPAMPPALPPGDKRRP